ncbi:tripartite motif containing 16, partial [Homo sapiens]
LSQKGYLKKENMAALCRTAESQEKDRAGDQFADSDPKPESSLGLHLQAELQCTQLDLERKLKLNENAISRLQANQKSVLVSVSEVKAVAEMQFGELLAAVRKAQANVMLFLEEKEQAALSQANGIKAHLEYRSAEMEKSKQELERMAAISNTVQFLEEYCKFKNTEDITFPSVYVGLKDKLSGI